MDWRASESQKVPHNPRLCGQRAECFVLFCLKCWLVHYFHHSFSLGLLSPACCSAEGLQLPQDDKTFACCVFTEE